MRIQLDALECHGELALDSAGKRPGTSDPEGRYNPAVRAELLAMSAASIDRYLAPAKAKDAIKGKSTTKPSPLLRNSIKIRKADDEAETEPGFFEGDTTSPAPRSTGCWPRTSSHLPRSAEMTAYRDTLNPAAIGRQIGDLQAVLLKLAAEKTEQLYLATIPTALVDGGPHNVRAVVVVTHVEVDVGAPPISAERGQGQALRARRGSRVDARDHLHHEARPR